MAKYEKEFSRLSKYAPKSVLTEKFRCRQFEEGLHESIKRYLTAVTSLQVVNFYQLVQAAIKIEKSEMKSQERMKENKFSRGGSSSGKRPRESKVDSIQGSTIRGRRQGPTMTQSSGRGISTRQEEIHACSLRGPNSGFLFLTRGTLPALLRIRKKKNKPFISFKPF